MADSMRTSNVFKMPRSGGVDMVDIGGSNGGGVDGGGDGPQDGDMRERVARIEATLEGLATKADVVTLGKEISGELNNTAKDLFKEFHHTVGDYKKWTLTVSWSVIAIGIVGVLGLLFTIYNTNNRVSNQQPVVRELSAPSAAGPIIIYPPYPPSSQGDKQPEPKPMSVPVSNKAGGGGKSGDK